MAMSERVLLVIPCYNEEKRIDMNAFKAAPANVSFLFVDDGSRDNTYEHIRGALDSRMKILKLDANAGKAEAVRRGVLHARDRSDLFTFDWVGYWDADLSTPLFELENFIAYNKAFYGTKPVVFGSRVLRFGGNIQRHVHRHLLGRFFATVVQLSLGIGSYDSQCGAKIFRKDMIDICFAEEFVSRWIFDVEIVLRLGNKDIVEYPLKVWRDVTGSKLNVRKVALAVVRDILAMKKKFGAVKK